MTLRRGRRRYALDPMCSRFLLLAEPSKEHFADPTFFFFFFARTNSVAHAVCRVPKSTGLPDTSGGHYSSAVRIAVQIEYVFQGISQISLRTIVGLRRPAEPLVSLEEHRLRNTAVYAHH
jgi:hypothetical protein